MMKANRNRLNLVAPKAETEQAQGLLAYPTRMLAEGYGRLTRREWREEHAMERAAAGPQKDEFE